MQGILFSRIILMTYKNKLNNMNKSKALILMIVCGLCATLFTTSCLNSDDNNNSTTELTRDDSTECVLRAIGTYTGEIVYTKPATTTAQSSLDSVDVSWEISAVTSTYGSITMNPVPCVYTCIVYNRQFHW